MRAHGRKYVCRAELGFCTAETWRDRRLLDKIYYTVNSLEGDYAYLRKDGGESDELKCVARALLPPETSEGSRLVYEMMEYSLEGIANEK